MLVIDDSDEIVEIVSVVLSDLFEKVDAAGSVEEAIELLAANLYSLVVLDINLEGRNGAEVIKFLIEAPDNANKNAPFIIMSGIITSQFVERNSQRFAGILAKPFEHDDLRKKVEEILGAKKVEVKTDEVLVDEIPYLKCDLPFPIYQLEQRVSKIMGEVKKNSKLKQLFAQMNIDRNADNYFLTHIGMLINISTAICINMDWNTDKTLEKFVYAAYLHDMALSSKPELARINSLEELEARKETLTAHEYKLIFEHPNIAARSIDGMVEIPTDVSMIIKQHHELPKETGFPAKCGYQKIPPLSVVFIVAHDLTDYIFANPKWTIEEYIKLSRSKFKGSHFSKILLCLSDVK